MRSMRTLILAVSIAVLAALLLVTSPRPVQSQIVQGYPGIATNNWTVVEDSSLSTTFTLGSTGGGGASGEGTDFDTSAVYNAWEWDYLTWIAAFASAGDADSVGTIVRLEGSLDLTDWVVMDTVVLNTDAERTPVYTDLLTRPVKYVRWIATWLTGKQDWDGATGTIDAMRWGHQ